MVVKGWLWRKGHPLDIYGSGVISGTEDKRPNMMEKDVPITLNTEEIPGVSGAVS